MRFLLLPVLLVSLASCALAQRGALRGERVIITNQDTPTYPPNDLIIRNATLDNRIQLGINAASDESIVSVFNKNDNLSLEMSTVESTSMLRILADSPNANVITMGVSSGGTALDVGYLDVRGEDRASGLDAYSAIVGGDLYSSRVTLQTFNAGAAELVIQDAAGGASGTIRGYNGTSTGFTLYLPGTSLAAAGCSPCYLEIDETTGNMSFTSGSGGGSLPVVDTTSLVYGSVTSSKQLRLEVDGLTAAATRIWTAQDTNLTVAGIDAVQTWTATQFMRDINPSTDSTYNIGNNSARYGGIYADVLYGEAIGFRYQGSASNNWSITSYTPGAELNFNDSGGNPYLQFQSGGSGSIQSRKSFYPVTTFTIDLGSSGSAWDNVYGNTYTVNTAVLPDASAGADIGSASLRFLGHYDDITMYNNPIIAVDASNSGTIGTSTTIWGGVFSGAMYLGRSATISGLLDMYNASTAGAASLRTNNLSGAVDFETQDHIYPSATGTLDLGTSARRWRKIWVTDIDISGTCTGCGSSSLPVADTTAIVKGSADATKLLAFEVDGFTTLTTRTLTPQNANYTIAGTNIAQTFSATQTFQSIAFSSDNTYAIGTTTVRPSSIYGYSVLLGRSGVASGNIQMQSTVGTGFNLGVNTSGYMTLDNNFYPAAHNTYNMGNASNQWLNVFANNVLTGLSVSTSGAFYGPSGVAGTSSTLACGAGLAVKNITVSGGVVTSVSCGAP